MNLFCQIITLYMYSSSPDYVATQKVLPFHHEHFDRILTKGFRRPNRVARDMMGDVGTSNESNKSRLTSDSDIASEVLAPSDVVRTSNKST